MSQSWRVVSIALMVTGIASALLFAGMGLAEQASAATDAPDADATVTVAHYAPFTDTVAGTSVSVLVDGSEVITDLVFGEVVADIPLPAGTYTIEIAPTGGTPVLTKTVTVSDDMDYTLAAIGGANGWPLELNEAVNETEGFTSTGKVRITHFAPFAALSDDTKVDICTDAGVPVTGLTDIPYKATTDYLPLGPGVFDLHIATTGNCGTPALDLPPFALAAGQVADIYAIGVLTGDLALQVSQSGLQARIAVGHLAPFSNTVAGTSVTVKLDGSDVLTDVVFGDISPYIPVAPGDYDVEIVPTGASEAAITGTAVVSGFVDFTFAAAGDVVNQPLGLVRYEDDNVTPPTSGKARVRIAHWASVSSDLAATRVDLCDATTSTALLPNLEYGQDVTLELDAGVYDVFLAAAGTSCAAPLIDIEPFVLQDGDIAYLYAAGNIVNLAPTVISVPPLTLAAQVAIAHFAPFANTVAGTEVTIQINGSDFLTGFEFSQITGYVALAAGSYDVAVIPTAAANAAADPAITGTLTISEGVDYTVAAIGDGANQDLALKAFVDDNSAAPAGKARVRAAHLAPFADTLEGTTVDLCTTVGGAPLVDNFKFGEDATLLLDEGVYTGVFIGAADPNCSAVALPIPPFVAADGGVGYLYAVGGANSLPLSVVATPDELLAAQVAIAHFAPFANTVAGTEVTIQIDGSDFLTGFVYSQITPYVALPAGSYDVAVIPTATALAAADPAITGTLTISPGVDYTAAAIGDGPNQDLALKVFVDDNSPAPAGKARIRAAHLAPFADTLEGTTVDLCTSVGGAPLADDFKYGEDATLLLDAGLYTGVFIGAAEPDCSAVALPIPAFVATDGGAGYIYALGGANSQPLSVVAQPDDLVAKGTQLPAVFKQLK